MDDATSDIYSAFFVAEEGTMSSFQGVSEAIRAKGLFCSLYTDRASHYWNTPEAGGKDRECQKICARAVLSDIDEPFAEDDGELCFGLEPFPRRTFPRLGCMIENEI